MQSDFPAVDELSASKTRIHFNLGTIGRIESHQVGRLGPSVLPTQAFYGALVDRNPGLPRPGRDLEAKLLRVPGGLPLVLLGALHHGCMAYYGIFDPQERTVRSSLAFACSKGRLELGFAVPGKTFWTAMFLDAPVQERLTALLAKHGSQHGRSSSRDQSWRDQLGLLLLGLPSLLAEAEPEAVGCAHHSVILFSGDRAAHRARLERGWP
ncbi:hypothetical protein [Ramlibacter humi]|uniref:Uncharacterized protein n=1 Tax=Ramlibacter humi TaxID=2530451 RepID=A0A4Z0CEQ1_9BURK|nr:hypothetical protein [Ramlibacter humi]TFZ08955.1 hypothetical protein EZ216_07385 [Ramlibacter humi]